MQNSAALKYLNDGQLATVAQNSPKVKPGTHRNLQSLAPAADLSRFGVSEDLLSDATKCYLRQNGLNL